MKKLKKFLKAISLIIKAESGKQELFISREFEATRQLGFKVFTNPHWWPSGLAQKT